MTTKKRKWLSYLKAIREEAKFGPKKEIRDLEGKLHSETEPAYVSPTRVMWYRNGRKHGTDTDIHGSVYFYFNGVMIPPSYHRNPEKLSIQEILNHSNTEVRRVGIEIYGIERLENENIFQVIDEEKNGSKLLSMNIPKMEEAMYVKVFNSSPEIDGSHRVFYLCVPPTMKSVKEAIAWTFYMDKEKYHPNVET